MESMEGAYGREQLKARIAELEQQIALHDSRGEAGPEVDELHQEHEELMTQLDEMDSGSDDLEKAA